MKINYTFEIDAVSAFRMLCETLKMEFVLDEDTDFRYHKGKVYVMRNGKEYHTKKSQYQRRFIK